MNGIHKVVGVLCLLFAFYQFTSGQNSTNTTDEVVEDRFNTEVSHCFNFTWVGPRFDNTTDYNTTCAEYKDERSSAGIPCADPFVITYDGSRPDLDYLWANYRTNVSCRQALGDSCIKWSYYFNNHLQNVTRMCGKVWASDGGVITSGCYSQNVSGYDVEFCVCDSSPGGYKPCNGAFAIGNLRNGFVFTIFVVLYLHLLD